MGKCTTIFSIFVLLCLLPPNIDAQPIEYKNQKENTGKTILAVKNNLLYDIALAPNIEIEVPIGRQWSLNAEYKCPWWLNSKHGFCYQLLSGGVEARCWLGKRKNRERLTGHFLGIYAEGGVYDFQFDKDKGYRGNYYAASGGNRIPQIHHLRRRFDMDEQRTLSFYGAYKSQNLFGVAH